MKADRMEKEYSLPLKDIRPVGKDNYLLTFQCPEIASRANPGQFVNISCGLFLKRPFGICSADPKNGEFSIGVRVIGDGTRRISQSRVGDVFEILGPLGHGFNFEGIQRLLVVGGGTGVFPLHFALSRAAELGIPTICVNGYRSASETVMLDECRIASDCFCVSTDAGDLGTKGTVIDVLSSMELDPGLAVFTVGPEIMMKKVSEWAVGRDFACQVSMEKRMACGVGACLVCVCKMKAADQPDGFTHVRCCKEGPVMNASEVVW